MSTALKNRLDAMAAEATAGIELHDPSSPIVLDDYRQRPRLVVAAAAAAIVVALVAGVWINRDNTTVVDVAGKADSRPMPAVFNEATVPLDELPEWLRTAFDGSRIRPLEDLNPDAPEAVFPGVHLIQSGDISVAVGLDTTGQLLCVATTIDGVDGATSSCGTPAQFAYQNSSFMKSSSERTVTTVLVGDDVVAVELAGEVYPVERNIVIIEGPNNGVLNLQFADGTVEAAGSFPVTAEPIGELVDPVAGAIKLSLIGCATTSEGVLAEVGFVGPNGLVSGVLAPTGVYVAGTIDETKIDVVAPNAVIETTVVDGSLVISATWETPEGQGRLSGNCVGNHIDLSDLR